MVAKPAPTGAFDPAVSPEVLICRLAGSTCAGGPIAHFTTTSGPGSETVRLSATDSLYIVNWHTDQFVLDPAATYRIVVTAIGVTLGSADVQVVLTGGQVKNVQTSQYVPLVDGKTLPIKFRIEQGLAAAISVAPTAATIPGGATQQFAATVSDLHGATIPGAVVAWSSADTSVAAVDATGLASGVAPGATTIHATSGTLSADASLTVIPSGFTLIAGSLAAGQSHTCGLAPDHTAWCWGANSLGQLGTGTETGVESKPVPVSGNHKFAMIAAGWWNTCAITLDGVAYCWGYNEFGQLGDGDFVRHSSPTPVTTDLRFTSISTAGGTTCAVAADGSGWCWGRNADGAVGYLGPTTPVPVPVDGGHTFTTIVAGHTHSCGLDSVGTAWCWGNGATRATGSPVPGAHTFTSITVGEEFSCGLDTAHQIWCWGTNDYGIFGNGTTNGAWGSALNGSSVPMLNTAGLVYTAMSATDNSICALAAGGTTYCWGWNKYGQLGDGTTTDNIAPSLVLSPVRLATLGTANGDHMCATSAFGVPYCWGDGEYGQLGNNGTAIATTPVPVSRP